MNINEDGLHNMADLHIPTQVEQHCTVVVPVTPDFSEAITQWEHVPNPTALIEFAQQHPAPMSVDEQLKHLHNEIGMQLPE